MALEQIHAGNSLIIDKISRLRDSRTDSDAYVRLIEDLSTLLAFHIGRRLPTTAHSISTPRCDGTAQYFLSLDRKILIFSLFRAALPMAQRVKSLFPGAGIIHVVYKNKEIVDIKDLQANPSSQLSNSHVVIADPIIGTGGSILKVLDFVTSHGVPHDEIQIVCIAAVTSGIARIEARYPGVQVTTLTHDDDIFPDGYLNPGFGDVGNRVFGLSE